MIIITWGSVYLQFRVFLPLDSPLKLQAFGATGGYRTKTSTDMIINGNKQTNDHTHIYIYVSVYILTHAYLLDSDFFYAAPCFFLCCLACGFFFMLELSFFYAEGPSVCHIPLFLMRQGVLLYAVGCFSLCYSGVVLMPFGSGDGSNP